MYSTETYWGKPVGGFGDSNARLWIVGLAPAAHGANRTGRMFTGDSSGLWLYRALHRVGLAKLPTSESMNDGQTLYSTFISAAARCAPPDNKPKPEELARCSNFLERELDLLINLKVILALGSIAFSSILKILHKTSPISSPQHFGHGKSFHWGKIVVISSYHPSRQNTQTGRLTLDMWNGIFDVVSQELIHP